MKYRVKEGAHVIGGKILKKGDEFEAADSFGVGNERMFEKISKVEVAAAAPGASSPGAEGEGKKKRGPKPNAKPEAAAAETATGATAAEADV